MRVIGLMSGTSADGIDAALCEITGAPPQINARILHSIVQSYPEGFQARILDACVPAHSRVDLLCELNAEIGELFAGAALRAAAEAGLPPDQIDLIGSHGQTFWHNVQPDGRVSATLQLGDASIIAERTGITTVSNFRPRDVAAGGQGAPLTSYVDWLLLRHPTRWRAVQNIGGMGNVTFLPPLADTSSPPLAFDTGPGNALIDTAMYMLSDGKAAYDHDGQMAARGQVDESWLDELLRHPYYQRKPPKTTGRELFGAEMAHTLLQNARDRGIQQENVLATLTMLTAVTITEAYRQFAPAPVEEVILGGGGRRNPVLVDILRGLLPEARVLIHEDLGIDSDNKEALVFAILAYETWHNRPGTHPALTGARHAAVLGQITPGDNFAHLLQHTWCGHGG